MGGLQGKLFGSSGGSKSEIKHKTEEIPYRFAVSPFVYYRRGSMYVDEEGDTAHEFYEERRVGPRKWSMQRVFKNLKPQGLVKLEYPRLHPDLPAIVYECDNSTEDLALGSESSVERT
ncbi:unnamed protein product [Cyprideis torosa]|uniref:Uncharacterized protein n=1 Tax=Cyprideis torosa TaxID=163714 RepID=A0A7R8WB63_9CRUS|nr:unnamed protein product [Cyprideis torosa]CAG0886109.1 unnamed protein product [Cyprideis torosa]